MQYRKFGRQGWDVSSLGFGAMRFPVKGNEARGHEIDVDEAVSILRRGIDAGINYIDTAYVYHGGESERVVGVALRDGYRAKVRIATKSPVWMIQQAEDFDRFLGEQLERLQTDHIDCYLLHALDKKRWPSILKLNVLERAEKAIRDGRIGCLGFSFHDDYETFEEILRGYDWAFTQIQYNYMDTENQAGEKGLKLAAAAGVPVIVMEPLLGGRLANPPAVVREVLDRAESKRTPADWALQWIWSQPEVTTVLSGMSSMEQLEQNLDSERCSRIGSMTAADFATLAEVKQRYSERIVVPCTKCNYCMPCPSDVNIPRNFELFNDAHLHDDFATSRFVYKTFTPEAERASACIACKECEEQCPQGIAISEWMRKVAEALGA